VSGTRFTASPPEILGLCRGDRLHCRAIRRFHSRGESRRRALLEDGIASTARSAALERENEQRALAAEKFSTVSSLVNPRLRPAAQAFKQLWNDMVLYDEHTWGDNRSVSNPQSQEAKQQQAIKEDFASDAKNRVNDLLWRSLAALADDISDPHDTLLVFNPLSWQRSSLVEIDLDKGLELVDLTTQQSVPYEVLSSGPAYRHIRFMAQDVPSVGYKAYAMRPTQQPAPAPPSTSEATVENQYYRVVLDPESGAVKSIFDKELNKELVNTSAPTASINISTSPEQTRLRTGRCNIAPPCRCLSSPSTARAVGAWCL